MAKEKSANHRARSLNIQLIFTVYLPEPGFPLGFSITGLTLRRPWSLSNKGDNQLGAFQLPYAKSIYPLMGKLVVGGLVF